MRPLFALALLVGLAPAAPVPKALKKTDDATLLVGTWNPVTKSEAFMRFDADGRMVAWNADRTAETGSKYTWTIDPSADPRTMNWGQEGQTVPQWECVYELTGDTLRISYNTAGKRPGQVSAATRPYYFEFVRDSSDK